MSGEPVQLFAHIRLGGDQHCLLVQPVGIEAVGGFQQSCDLIGDALLDGVGPTGGSGLSATDQSRDLFEPSGQDAGERAALTPPVLYIPA